MTKRMKKPMKNKWVEALRSGKYHPGKGFLREPISEDLVRYDPLGVLCDLHYGDRWKNISKTRPDEEVLMKYRIRPSAVDHLIMFNDVHRKTFKQSADWIEENL